MIDTTRIPGLLAEHGIDGVVGTSFGSEALPKGLRTVIGRKRLSSQSAGSLE
jgi:hypothetical protein